MGSMFIQVLSTFVLCSISTNFLIFTIGFCTFATAFVLDIEEKLRQLNIKLNLSSECNLYINEQLKLEMIFVDVVKFHSVAKSLSSFFDIKLFHK